MQSQVCFFFYFSGDKVVEPVPEKKYEYASETIIKYTVHDLSAISGSI